MFAPDSRTPATKAPSVSLKPMRCVMRLAPVTVSRHSATKVSSLLASATSSNTLQGWKQVAGKGSVRGVQAGAVMLPVAHQWAARKPLGRQLIPQRGQAQATHLGQLSKSHGS